MEIIDYSNISIEDSRELSVSAIICASGYESRCTEVAKKFSNSVCDKYVISFNNYYRHKQRKANDIFFKENNYSFVYSNDDDYTAITDLFDAIILNCSSETCYVVIDYSSMPRIWYAGLLKFLSFSTHYNRIIKILFCYSFSVYSPPQKTGLFNKYVGPINGYCSLSIPDKPTALLLGLGYEKGRAYGLREYLDAETYVFYTSPEKHNSLFSGEVKIQNSEIFNKIPNDHIIKYPISNLEYTINIVYSLCSDLIDDFRIILAPCGPKPFTLACLITSLKLQNVDVWRISAGKEKPYVREASGIISVLQCVFK